MAHIRTWFRPRRHPQAMPVLVPVLFRAASAIFVLVYFLAGGTAGNDALAVGLIAVLVTYLLASALILALLRNDGARSSRYRAATIPLEVILLGLTAAIDPRSLALVALLSVGAFVAASGAYRWGVPAALGALAALTALAAAVIADANGLAPWDWGLGARLMVLLLAAAHWSGQSYQGERAAGDRNATLAQVRRSERRFRDLFEGAGDGIIITDMAGVITDCNAQGALMGGYTREDLLGRSAMESVPESARGIFAEMVGRLLAGEDVPPFESDFYSADGTIYPAEATTRMIHDEEGQLQGFQVILRRIEERKRAERELERRARYLAAIAELEQLLLGSDVSASFQEITSILAGATEASRVYVARLSTEAVDGVDELVLRVMAETAAEGVPAHAERNAAVYRMLGQTQHLAPLLRGEIVVAPSGELGDRGKQLAAHLGVESFLALPIMVHGEFAGYVGFDECEQERTWQPAEIDLLRAAVTALSVSLERERAEQSRVISERRYRAIFGGAGDGIIEHRLDGTMVDVNGDLMRTLGYARDDLIGRSIMEFIASDQEQLRDTARRLLRQEIVVPQQAGLRDSDGRVVPMQLTTHVLYDAGGTRATGFLTILRDVSETKRAEQELERRARYLSAIADAEHHLLESPGRASYGRIVSILADVINADRVFISELHPGLPGEEAEHYFELQAEYAADGIVPYAGQDAARMPVTPGRAMLMNRLRAGRIFAATPGLLGEDGRAFAERWGMQSLLVIPITVNGELFGFVSFEDCTSPRQWQETEIALLRATADVMAVSLERELAGQELQRRARYLAALADVEQQLMLTPGRAAYGQVVQILSAATGADRVYLFEVEQGTGDDPAGRNLVMKAEACVDGVQSYASLGVRRVAVDDTFAIWLDELDRQPVVTGVRTSFTGRQREVMERAGALSFLAIPLVVGGRLFGHVAFDDCKQERIWGEIEIDLLRAAASALAVSLEREQATAALTHSELRFRDLVQSVDAIVYEADAETFAFEFVSEKVNDILGFPRERWIEEPMFWQEHIHEEDRERVLKLCRTATAEMRDHQFEYRMIAADGREVWLRDLVTVEVADGRPSRLRGLMIDITAERRVAEAMQQGQKFMEDLVANSPMGLSMYLPGGMTISTNDAQRRLLAIEDFAWDADNFNILTDPIAVESGLADVARRAFDGETVELAEVVLRLRHPGRSTGPYEERLVEVTLFPGIDARGNVEAVVGFTRDVTERRRQDDVLREAQKLESLGVLAGGVAHDLNNLLLGILGNASLAMDDTSPGSPAYFSLQEIELAGQRAAELGRQMLDYSGRSRFRLERLDASTLIDEMRPLLKAVVPVPVGLTFDLADGLPHIEGDAGQLRQVMLNMVLNAGEAFEPEAGTGDSPPAEIFVVTRAREVAEDDLLHTAAGGRLARGQYAVIEVRDTGSGIDPVMLDRIFDPFFTTRFTGRGLGLAAALGIVRGHGGGIAVDSIPGRGTIFSIFLPVAEDMRHD